MHKTYVIEYAFSILSSLSRAFMGFICLVMFGLNGHYTVK